MKKLLVFLLFATVSFSCKKVFFEEEPSTTPTSVFEQTWTYVNENYSFFEFKNINWDSVKTVHEPLVSDDISEDSLFSVLSDMLYVLRDGHVNLVSRFDVSRNWAWYLDYPANYDANLLERHYFKEQQQLIGPFTVFDFEDVGYLHYASFSSTITEETMQLVLDKFRSHKGLIIDVRDNGGGAISNVYAMANHFVDDNEVTAYQRIKNGPGKDDYTEFYGMQLSPIEEHTAYAKPVILLTNRKCYSATNMLRTVMGSLKNVTVVGDKTGGGGGVPTYTQLSNGWVLRVSSSQTFTLDGTNNEDGLDPDIQVDQTQLDDLLHRDALLEEALKLLRE